jgi:hypothetical protein
MFDDSLVSYDLEVQYEDTPIRGNVMCSGDDDYDRECEDKVIADLIDGNVWAWCCVKCTARYDGIDSVTGVDYLGGCSYASEEDFTAPGGYWDDMKDVARDDLYTQLESIAIRLRMGCDD